MKYRSMTVSFPHEFNRVEQLGAAGYAVNGKVITIKAIRELTGLGLTEAKDIVDKGGRVLIDLQHQMDIFGLDFNQAIINLRSTGCDVWGSNIDADVQQGAVEMSSLDMLKTIVKRELDLGCHRVALRVMEVIADHYTS